MNEFRSLTSVQQMLT